MASEAEAPAYEVVGWVNPRTGKAEGRCMRATRDFEGKVPVVLKEAPMCHVACKEDVCDACLEAPTSPSVCAGCKAVTYCSEKCQRKGWRGWHKKECKMLAKLKADEDVRPTPTLLMTFRALAACDGDFNHPTLTELVHHREGWSAERREMYAHMAVLLAAMCRRAEMPEASMDDALTLFARLEVNSFSVLDHDFSSSGYAVYRIGAAVNHSCEPNLVATFDGASLQLRPVKDVKKGDELTISYVELASTSAERNKELRERYGFECACARCARTGAKLEAEFPPGELSAGTAEVESFIASERFESALEKAVGLLPFMALYGNDIHPSVGLHWLNIARLKWRLEDTNGTFEAGMIAVSILEKTQHNKSKRLREAAELTAQANQLRMS